MLRLLFIRQLEVLAKRDFTHLRRLIRITLREAAKRLCLCSSEFYSPNTFKTSSKDTDL